jgi:hypothetical protein
LCTNQKYQPPEKGPNIPGSVTFGLLQLTNSFFTNHPGNELTALDLRVLLSLDCEKVPVHQICTNQKYQPPEKGPNIPGSVTLDFCG